MPGHSGDFLCLPRLPLPDLTDRALDLLPAGKVCSGATFKRDNCLGINLADD